MVKTQVQLPDELYREAKRVAAEKEWSLAEVVRRGLEYIVSVYPSTVTPNAAWKPPEPRRLGWRGLSPDQLRHAALETNAEYQVKSKGRRAHVVR